MSRTDSLTSKPVVCPDCRNTFLQPFVCTTCGAQKLYDETVRSQAATIDRLTRREADLVKALENIKAATESADFDCAASYHRQASRSALKIASAALKEPT